jgi:rSAM/selenodomain-associated transferase 2
VISIIIPTKNEEAIIHQTVKNLQDLRKNNLCEIIIVDGMSNDQTIKFSEPYVDLIITSEPNRGIQQNKGAMLASGEILVFLHADTIVTKHQIKIIRKIKNFNWGFFKISFERKDLKYKFLAFCINLRSYLFNYATGDQVFCINKKFFKKVGGFPNYELMEDIKISSKLKKHSKPKIFKEYIKTSARRWENNGFIWTIIKMRILRLLYYLNVKPSKLKTYYK